MEMASIFALTLWENEARNLINTTINGVCEMTLYAPLEAYPLASDLQIGY